jgi:hypothetical protein
MWREQNEPRRQIGWGALQARDCVGYTARLLQLGAKDRGG